MGSPTVSTQHCEWLMKEQKLELFVCYQQSAMFVYYYGLDEDQIIFYLLRVHMLL